MAEVRLPITPLFACPRADKSGLGSLRTEARDAKKIKSLTKEDMLNFFDQHLAASAPGRSKLSIHIRSQRLNTDAIDRLKQCLSSAQLKSSPELEAKLADNPTFDDTRALLESEFAKSSQLPSVLEQLEKIRWPETPQGTQEVDKSWRQSLKLGPVARPIEPLSTFNV